jgi:hypothetical protein
MPTRRFRILSALCGILGVAMVMVSFNLNPGPPANASIAQVMVWGRQYLDSIMLGAWLQAVGSFLSVVFAVAIVHMAGATTRFWGAMTVFGGIVLVGVSLLEVTFYIDAAQGGVSGNTTTVSVSLDLITTVQRLFPILAAPALFFPLGAVILDSRVLPPVLGYLSLVLGGAFAISGVVYLFAPILAVVVALSIIQGVWFLAAAITLLVRTLRASDVATAHPA